jgi:Uma2 family endonuclease
MSAIPPSTEAEYLAWDLAHDGRHEFVNGQIVAMAGAGEEHGLVVTNATLAFGTRLRGSSCRVFVADLRVRIDETGLYAYPDLVVVCGERRFAPTTPESLLNPTVLLEVASPTTEAYDRGAKAAHYRRRPSVQDIVLLDPGRRTVEHYRRLGPEQWHLETRADGEIALESLGIRIPVAELFDGPG